MVCDYDKKSLVYAYQSAGLSRGRVVYLTGNLGALGRYQKMRKEDLLRDHLDVIMDLIGNEGTLVVPTHTWSLCNTELSFDVLRTPSETGVFTEFVRCLDGSVRQFHPFSSSTAFGADSGRICTKNSRHVYGPNSPFDRMIDAEALHVSVGMPINKTVSAVHHAELLMGVPYRYTKEFVHPCVLDGELIWEEFYLYVLRRDVDINRDSNRKILDAYRRENRLLFSELGRSSIQSLDLKKFFDSVVNLLTKDIYAWLQSAPVKRESYRL